MDPSLTDPCDLILWFLGSPGTQMEEEAKLVGEIWRATNCSVTIGVLSFLPFRFFERISIMSETAPGVQFIPLPLTRNELEDVVGRLRQPTHLERSIACRWFSGLQQQWIELGHDIARSICNGGLQNSKGSLEEMSQLVEVYAPDSIALVDEFKQEMGSSNALERLGRLQDALIGKSKEHISNAPSDQAPLGYETVGVADNDGYDESTLKTLEGMGYKIYRPIALSPHLARQMLELAKPSIILADVGFPAPIDGLAFMALASEQPWVKLVIAVSHGRVSTGTLPINVEDCCGGNNWNDAERIHRVIWRRAIEHGVCQSAKRSSPKP